MSLILDALKRAERERKAQASPMLADLAHSSPAPVRRRWRQHWRMGGVALLALIMGVLLWTALRNVPRRAPEAVSGADLPTPRAPALAPVPSVIPGTEAVASLDDLADDSMVAEDAESEPQPAPPAAAAPAPSLPQQSVAQPESPAPVAEPAPQAQPVPADGTSSAAPPEPVTEPAPSTQVPPVLTRPAALRKLREMPPDYRADFPALSVEVHVYEREIAKRLVMINGRRYREGERLAEGPVVMEIVREGIVFEHRGEKVLYTLGR